MHVVRTATSIYITILGHGTTENMQQTPATTLNICYFTTDFFTDLLNPLMNHLLLFHVYFLKQIKVSARKIAKLVKL